MIRLILFILLLFPSQSFAAFTASAVMELRSTGGSNLNSGVFDSGVASAGTDYTQQDASQFNGTDLASTNGTTNPCVVTSAGHNFISTDNGNSITISAGTSWTPSVYIIVSTSANAATLDKACGSAASISSGTWREGGAYPMGNSTAGIKDDSRFALLVAGNTVWVKNGTYTINAVNVGSGAGSVTSHVNVLGYNASHADNPTGTNRPTFSCGSGQFFSSYANWTIKNLIINGSISPPITTGSQCYLENIKVTNPATSAGSDAISVGTGNQVINSEFVSQNGVALHPSGSNSHYSGIYIHDSDVGVNFTGTSNSFKFFLVEGNKTAGFKTASTGLVSDIENSTIYGSEAKIGEGIQTTGATAGPLMIRNCIFYGLSKGIDIGTASQDSVIENYNDFFNNTTDRTNIATGANSIALNPTFTGATQITGTTATTSGSVLTQSGGDFSTVTDNIDYLRVTSGTGVTTGIYLITGHTATTLTTNNALGTSSGGDVVYTVPTGHNFNVGTNLKATGYPGAFNSNSSETTGYLDIGAVQRQEPSSSGGTGFFIQ